MKAKGRGDFDMRITRRSVVLGLALAVPVAVVGTRAVLRPQFDGGALTPAQAHEMALKGEIFLIDIRRPDEWAATGSGEGAVRIDLRDDDFQDQLLAVSGSFDAPIALICAAGVRSARLGNQLAGAGFTQIIDVPEGMTGGIYGPGWVNAGLPVVGAEYGQ